MESVKRISDTVQEFCGERFYLCGAYFQHGGKRLHRAVWEHYNSEIPRGYHVHHIDKDRTNNDISNLMLIQGTEHLREHMYEPERIERSRKNIKNAALLAAKWHGSESGKEWHSKHAREYWENANENEYVCDECGKHYRSKNVSRKGNHFCSNRCKSSFRHKSGVDNEIRTCPVCGEEYTVNRYSKNKTCGYECARILRWGK